VTPKEDTVEMADVLARRTEAASRVKAAAADEAEALYRAEYLPATAAYLAARGTSADVLVATVGTQPFSVALSLAYTRAARVYFIHTDESRRRADEALTLAQSPPGDAVYRPVGKADSVAVYREIRQAVEDNPGRSIIIDFTSGTKAMTAAASTVAGHLRLRQVYIESSKLRDQPLLFGNEEPHVVDHPLLALGDPQREEAERFFDNGHFETAQRLFADLRRVGVPGYCLDARIALCRGYGYWDALRFVEAGAELEAAVAALRGVSPAHARREQLLSAADQVARQAARARELARATGKDARTPHDPELCNILVRYLLAAARRRERREPDLASLLLYRALELSLQRRLAVNGFDAGNFVPPDDPSLLARFNRLAPSDHKLAVWPAKLALAQCRGVLEALDDEALRSLLASVSVAKFNGMLEGRNRSLYAHGFRCLSHEDRAFVEFKREALRWVEAVARADDLATPAEDPDFDFVRLGA
jgi:CRISPR-associated protein (TIGR02710 family)